MKIHKNNFDNDENDNDTDVRRSESGWNCGWELTIVIYDD